MASVTGRCHPVQERTSYSSSPTSPLAASKQASIVQRVPATWTRVASDLDQGGKFCALRRERQIIGQLIQLLERAPDQERFLPAFTRAPERDTRPVVQARPLGPVAGAQPRPAPLGHLRGPVPDRPQAKVLRRGDGQHVALAGRLNRATQGGVCPAESAPRSLPRKRCRPSPRQTGGERQEPVPASRPRSWAWL